MKNTDGALDFFDHLSIARYCFEPYTLKYFHRYTDILRYKILLLLNIIEKISTKKSASIQDILDDLDIILDENGNITKQDIIRLLTPTIHNIQNYDQKINRANDLNTYLTFKESIHSLMRDGFSEKELYPSETLQIKNLWYDNIKGNINLSDRQKEALYKEQRKNEYEIASMLLK